MNDRKILSLFSPTLTSDLINSFLKQNRSGSSEGEEVLLTLPRRGKEIVARCSTGAAKRGVRPGMDAVSARAKAPSALLLPFSRERERELLEKLLAWSTRFSSVVALDTPLDSTDPFDHRSVGIHLEVGGSEKLFCGILRLMSLLERGLRERGILSRMCVTPTLGASWALSRYGHERFLSVQRKELLSAVERLPVASLRIPGELEFYLREVGLHSVRDVFALPRKSLGERFGSLLLKRLDELIGEREEPLRPRIFPARFAVEHVFENAITNREVLKEVSFRLLDRLLELLQASQEKPHLLALKVQSSQGIRIEKPLPLATPTDDATHLRKLVAHRVESLSLQEGITKVALSAPKTATTVAQNGTWLEQSDSRFLSQELGRLIDSLTLTLGKEALSTLQAVPSHIPERAVSRTPITSKKKRSAPLLSSGERPSLLISPPQAISVLALLPDKPPFRIRWREQTYNVLHGTGPERIASEWWKDDREVPPRDYFKVQLSSGLWVWIYRSAEQTQHQWFLHGIWA